MTNISELQALLSVATLFDLEEGAQGHQDTKWLPQDSKSLCFQSYPSLLTRSHHLLTHSHHLLNCSPPSNLFPLLTKSFPPLTKLYPPLAKSCPPLAKSNMTTSEVLLKRLLNS